MISEDDARSDQSRLHWDRCERLAQLEASVIATNADRKQRERLARLEASERLVSSISEGTSEQALDDIVHDVKSREASNINNEGWQSQIDFLLDAGYSEEELREMLKGC
jgi:hypothetical protein